MSARPVDLVHQNLILPPHSIEAEQAVLGSLILSDSSWDRICDRVSEDDFYRKEHRLIFRSIIALAQQDKPRDVVTLSEWLEQRGELEKAGGMLYLGTLAKDTPSAANVVAYADIVRERAMLRNGISIGEELASNCYNPGENTIAEIIDQAEGALMAMREIRQYGEPVKAGKILSNVIDVVDERYMNPNKITGIPSGLIDIDKKLFGFQKADLIIVAGRPSMGKTAVTMCFAEHASIRLGFTVLVFSLEMSNGQLMERLISNVGGIDFWRIRTGRMDDSDFPKMTEAARIINKAPLFIDDTPALSVAQVRARARRIKREHGLHMIIVDYLQLMSASGKKENRVQQIGEISRGLKGLAKEFDVPVIALSQLNRGLESRPDKRPAMSDLRESGDLEQDADIIAFMYRDVVYNKNTAHPKVAEFIIRKYRNGDPDTVYLHADLAHMRFQNHVDELPEYGNVYDAKGGQQEGLI